MWLKQSDPSCTTYKGFSMVSILFSLASSLGVVVTYNRAGHVVPLSSVFRVAMELTNTFCK